MKKWLEDESVKELLSIRDTIEALEDDELEVNHALWSAIAKGRLLNIFNTHPQRDLILEGLSDIDYDRTEYEEESDGSFYLLYSRSRDLRYQYGGNEQQVKRILAREFRHAIGSYILNCITSFTSETSELPQFITPSIQIDFVQNDVLKEYLGSLWREAYLCRKVGLITAGTVMLVSFIEGLLGSAFDEVLTQSEIEKYGKAKDSKGKTIQLPVEKWTLEMLLVTGQKTLGMEKPHWDMLRIAQSLRNKVHPMKSKKSASLITTDDLDSVWLSAQRFVTSVMRFVKSRQSGD